MQPSPIEGGYLILAFALSIIVWILLLRYKLSSQQEGRGSWYARKINGIGTEGLFSAMHFGLVILIIWFVILLFAPSYFPELLESTWIALPGLLLIGLVCGSVFGTNIEKAADRWRRKHRRPRTGQASS